MKNVIVYREPKLKPFPPSLQLDVPGATLPVKIEAARRAIALCTDLPELMRYKQQAEGLAAAVKIIKKTAPEIVASANAMVKQAWFRLGELLNRYSSISVPGAIPGKKGTRGASKSERRKVAESLGLRCDEMREYGRLGAASEKVRQSLIASEQAPTSLHRLVRLVPARQKQGFAARSQPYLYFSGGNGQGSGLTALLSAAKAVSTRVPAADLRALAPDEKKMIRKKIAEIMEYLDIIDEACK